MEFSRQKILKWVAISFSRESSWLKDRTWVSCIADRFFTIWATRGFIFRSKMFLCEVEDEIISYLALPPKCNQLPSVGSGISRCGGEGWCGEGAQYSLFFFTVDEKSYYWKCFYFYYYYYFFIVLILSYIEMKQPLVYMCSPSRSLLPPPSPPDRSRSFQCTRSERLSHASNLGWWSVSP